MAEISSFPKPKRERLQGETYRNFIQSIFNRDGWRCRNCGMRKNLTPHHLIKRSQSGGDTAGNVVTLCVICHDLAEANQLKIEVIDVIMKFIDRKGEKGGAT